MFGERLETLGVELADEVRHRFFGKYRGTVEDVDDPDKLGRIVAKVPSVYGDEVKSPAALPCVPFAGEGHGLVVLPKKGDGVWIEFEGGDPSKPIWTGCWWAKNELPSPGGPEGRVLVTPGGLKLVLDDHDKKIQLIHPDGAEITLTSNDITVKIGSAKVVLSSQGVSVNEGAFKVS